LTKIQFFFNVSDRLKLVTDIVKRRLLQKKTSLVFCNDAQELVKLSESLWGSNDLNFIPHLINSTDQYHQITLTDNEVDFMDDTIINYSNLSIDGFQRYLKLIEIVSNDDDEKIKARKRYKFFSECGYKIESIDVKLDHL
jgi:DNA polymerase-3 subunit chi